MVKGRLSAQMDVNNNIADKGRYRYRIHITSLGKRA
jgi:hypothetical protein